MAPAAALFRSLGDPTRLAIVRRLAVGPARVTDLVEAVGLAQSTVSKHLACLRDCGLVASEPVGRASLFRLTQPALVDLLGCAETVLADTGNAVALCSNLRRGRLRNGRDTVTVAGSRVTLSQSVSMHVPSAAALTSRCCALPNGIGPLDGHDCSPGSAWSGC